MEISKTGQDTTLDTARVVQAGQPYPVQTGGDRYSHIDDLLMDALAIDYPDETGPQDTPDVTDTPADLPPPASSEVADDNGPKAIQILGVAVAAPHQRAGRPSTTSPLPQGVERVIESGQTLEVAFMRTEQNGPITVTANNPAIVPLTAPTREVAAEAVPGNVNGKQVFPFWAVLEARPTAPTNGQADQASPTNGMRFENLTEATDDAFALIVRAEPASSTEHAVAVQTAHHYAGSLADTPDMDAEAAQAAVEHGRLVRALGSTAVKQTVLVGAKSKAALQRVAAAASGVMDEKAGQVWRPGIDKDTNKLTVYSSPEAASQAAALAPNYLAPKDFATGLVYPDHELNGWIPRPLTEFAVNRPTPEGAPTITVADLLDNSGKRVGELRLTLDEIRRHVLIAASSGAGKTALIHEMVCQVMQENYQERQAALAAKAEMPRQVGVVLIDCAKEGNHDRIADQAAAWGLPEEYATVRRITVGTDGVVANNNLLDFGRLTPREAAGNAAAILASGIDKQDAVSYRVFEKFLTMALLDAYERAGFDLDLGTKGYGDSMPALPTMAGVAAAIERVIAREGFDGEVQQNLGAFTNSEFARTLRSTLGNFLQNGYDLDWQKLAGMPGVTVFEISRMATVNERNIAITGIMHKLSDALESLKPAGVPGDIDYTQTLLIIDEGGSAFDQSSAGAANANFLTKVRASGMAVTIALQDPNKLHPDVLHNIHSIFALHLANAADHSLMASHMGPTTEQDLKFLSALTVGHGVFYGDNMPNGPVQFRTFNPNNQDLKPGNHEFAETVVRQELYTKLYDHPTMLQANKLLDEQPLGLIIGAWAELNVMFTATNRQLVQVGQDLKIALQAHAAKDTPDEAAQANEVLRCAIEIAVQQSVNGRRGLRRSAIVEYVRETMFQQAAGLSPKPVRRPDLALSMGRYTPLRDELVKRLSGKVLDAEEREAYAKVIGSLGGVSATEQRDTVHMHMDEACNDLNVLVTHIATKAKNAARPFVSAQKRREAAELIAKLIPDTSEASIAALQDKLEESRHDYLSDAELSALHELIATPGLDETCRDQAAYNFDAALAALDGNIKAAQKAKPLDVPGLSATTLAKQLEEVEALQAAHELTNPDPLAELDVFFAPHPNKPLTIMDDLVSRNMAAADLQGTIARDQEALHGQSQNYSYIAMLRRNDSNAGKWGDTLGKSIIRNGRLFLLTSGARHWLDANYTRIMGLLEERADHLRATAKASNTRAKGSPS